MSNRFALGEKIAFAEEPEKPYTVVGINSRYAILTRPTQEGEEYQDEPVPLNSYWYTIVDNESMMRGRHNLIFSPYDFQVEEDIRLCLDDLDQGYCELSRRNSIPVLLAE